MHSDATLITYTDFGQNTGRYKTTESANALLQHIRQQEGGVTITYTGGQQTYVMPHGMIDFGSTYHVATCAAISPSAIATVAHNYTFDSWFSNKVYGIGMENAVKYKGIELGEGVGDTRWNSNVFSHALSTSIGNATDHRVMRLSKVITDAPYAELYDTAGKDLGSLTYYHAGSGQQWRSTYNTTTLVDRSYPNNASQLISAYNYVIGGIVSGAAGYAGSTGFYSQEYFDAGGINASDPLTWVSRPGDSGSPLYVWDDASGTYQYIGSNRGEILSGQVGSAFVVDTTFDKQVVEERYTKKVNMGAVSEVYLNAVSTQGETVTDDWGRSTTKWLGTVTGEGMETVSFVGLKSGLNTWSDLSGLKDTQNWYTYGESYVAQSNQDLFFTENLVFNATAKENRIVLNDTVDLGIGYAEFSGGKFTISSAEGESNLFNHAGYVINEGAEVHVQLTNPAEYMREWRKIGAGDLYIEGSGNNDVLLNLGGSGKTYLNREGGYAAYNVLVNTGATVVISDAGQIKRDLTFGNRGGTLDMNGNSMDWYTAAEAADSTRAGFSINALTEDALVANYSGSSTLTYKEAGNTAYAGSFADSADSSLKIVYDEAEGTWTLNSIRTNLQHSDSGLQVDSGTVVLRGTNTIHGAGSASGLNENRYSHEDDWHYADAAMNVTVTDGGTFELGSHARLTGNVTVESGGTYVMREGVRHTQEYVEGGQVLEDTGKYAAYFGHKGDVVLNGGTFAVQFNEGVDSTTSYAGSVTGTGAMTVDAGTDGGTFAFSGEVADGVSKTLNRGQLQLTGAAAADIANKWLVNAGGVMVQFENAADTLGVIDAASTGVLGLNADTTTQLDLSSHSQLRIGALSGTTVQYGAAGTSEKLSSLNLGGGGTLVVNYALSGSDTLNVDGRGWSSGEVRLANVASGYSGTVNVAGGGGRVLLTTAEDGVFAGATVNINSGGVWQLNETQSAASARTLNVNEGGTLRGKNMVFAGAGTSLELRGSLDYDSFTVQDEATLNLRDGGRLDAENAATISGTGVMRLNRLTLSDKVNLENGGTMYGNGGTIGSGAKVLATVGTGKLNAGTGTFNVNGQIGAAEGATLRLENGAFSIYHGNLNADGGTLELATANISLGYLQSYGTQNIGGTLKIAENVTITANQTSTDYQRITHNVNHIHIDDGKSLSITETSNSWAHQWNIGSLTGAGEITWSANPNWYASGTSRMRLTGKNDFSGTLVVKQLYGGWSSLNDYSIQHLELAHDKAAHRMVISLQGDADSHPGLAINTNNAKVAGLEGTANTYLYAGPMKTDGQGGPGSSALNTLIINTAGKEHTYNGTILGDAANGLNIVKDGTGTQTFTNAANVVHDVTALQGHLEFTTTPTIHGDISIAQGAELTLGSGAYSLDAGHSLSVLAGAAGSSATLNNALVLNGGSLIFGAYGESSAALITGGVSLGAEVQQQSISFTNLGSLSFNKEYTLASGDWSALAGKLTIGDSGYLTASLSADANGLRASFEMAADYVGWTGDETVLTDNARVVFAGFGGVNTAEISENHTVAEGYFDNGETFTVSSANGSGLQFGRMEMTGSGAVVLNTAVSADTMIIKDAATIKGAGSLTVENLDIQSNLTTGMALDVTNNITAANGAQWILDGSEGEFTQNLSLGQMSALDSIRVEGDAVLSVDMGADDMSLTDARISGSGRLSLTGSGSFTKNYNGALNIADISLANATFKGNGTTTISGEVAISGKLDFGTEKVILASGADVTTNQLRLGTSDREQNTSLSIEAGATLNISGTTFTDKEGQDETISLLLAHWHDSASTLVLNGGTLNASGTTMHMGWDSGGTFQAMSGVANLKGILFSTTRDNADRFILGSEMSGTARVNIGSAGITGFRANDTVQLGNGTIAATSDFSITGNGGVVQLVGEETGTIFDTAGHTITVNSVMQGEGKLVVNGSGTLKLAHSSGSSDISDLSGTGMFVKAGAGNLNLHKASLANATFKGNGTTTISGEVAISGKLDFGTEKVILASGADVTTNQLRLGTSDREQNTSLSIEAGATLNISGTTFTDKEGQDETISLLLAHWHDSASTLVLNGGTLNASGTTMHMGWDSGGTFQAMSGVANLKGILFSTTRDNADRFILGSEMSGTARVNIGSAGITGFRANDTVQLGDGTILAMDDFVISGSNSVVLNGTTDKGTVFDANGHTITVQAAMDSEENSALTIQNGTLKQSGDMWFDRMHVAEGASFVKDSVEVIGQSAASAIVKSANASGDKLQYFNDGNHEIQNARVKVEAADARELKSQLTHSTVENAGSGHLTVSNTASRLSGVVASGGDMAVLNQGALSLDILDVAGGKTVGLYTGADTASEKAAATVSGTAAFGTGAVLNTACLTLADGATLEMSGLEAGAVTLSGALTFGTGLQMGESLLASVGALDYGETLNLFTGLSGVNLPVVVDTESSRVLASSVFSNVQSDTLYVDYRVIDNVGTLLVDNVPEPATATLSLMALAALAARRRRKA